MLYLEYMHVHTLMAFQMKQNSTVTPFPPKTNFISSFFTKSRRVLYSKVTSLKLKGVRLNYEHIKYKKMRDF